jgi:hypothetical protein
MCEKIGFCQGIINNNLVFQFEIDPNNKIGESDAARANNILNISFTPLENDTPTPPPSAGQPSTNGIKDGITI